MFNWGSNNKADVNIKDNNGKTALMYITEFSYPFTEYFSGLFSDEYDRLLKLDNGAEITKLLLENGAKVNVRDNTGKTPLMFVAKESAPEILKLLLENKADVNVKDNTGKTALMFASNTTHNIDMLKTKLADNVEAIKLLEDEDFDVIKFLLDKEFTMNMKDSNCETILNSSDFFFNIVENPQEAKIKLLLCNIVGSINVLLDNGADINAIDNDSKTVLMLAKEQSAPGITKLLLDKGAKINVKNSKD